MYTKSVVKKYNKYIFQQNIILLKSWYKKAAKYLQRTCYIYDMKYLQQCNIHTVSPDVVVVLAHTYTDRGATADNDCSILKKATT